MAWEFTTSPSYVDFGTSLATCGIPQLTVSIWWKTFTTSASGGGAGLRDIFVQENTSVTSGNAWLIRYDPNANLIEWGTVTSSINTSGGSSYGPVSANTWYNIVCIYNQYDVNGHRAKMFINGVDTGSYGTADNNPLNSVSSPLRVGSGWPDDARQTDGECSWACCWAAVLDQTAITALAAGKNPQNIYNGNIVFLADLEGNQSPEKAIIGGLTGTVTGSATQGPDPPVNAYVPPGPAIPIVAVGPSIPGSVWYQIFPTKTPDTTPPVVIPPPPPPPPPVIVPDLPIVHFGPSIPGTPWYQLRPYQTPANTGPAPPVVSDPGPRLPLNAQGPSIPGTFWYQQRPARIHQAPFSPEVPNAVHYPKYPPPQIGPAIPGSPWYNLRPAFIPPIQQGPPPPLPVGLPNGSPSMALGPRLPGLPWLNLFGATIFAPPGVNAGTSASPPPPPPPSPPIAKEYGGALAPFVPRVVAGQQEQVRLRRHTELVSEFANSLMIGGRLIKTGANTWTIPNDVVLEGRAPLPTDDLTTGAYSGQMWIDRTGGHAYICINAAKGSAIWKLMT